MSERPFLLSSRSPGDDCDRAKRLCYLTNRARRPTERSHAFASRLRIFHTTHRSLDFLRKRSAKGALEEIPAQGDTARPSTLERVDVLSFVLVEHSLQDKNAKEGSRHEP